VTEQLLEEVAALEAPRLLLLAFLLQVFYAGTTANPTGAWTIQAARNPFVRYGNELSAPRALVRDRGSQFVDAFDEIFGTEGHKILNTPVRSPVVTARASPPSHREIDQMRRAHQ
jgi:putative transposase